MYSTNDFSAALTSTSLCPIMPAIALAMSLGSLAVLTVTQTEARASAAHCGVAFDPAKTYPNLPQTGSPDLSGEAGVQLHLQHQRGVVELDGCLYELDRPIEIEFAGLDQVELLFEVYGASAWDLVFASEDGELDAVIEVGDGSFTRTMTPASGDLGFELASSGQGAPTTPVVIVKPIEDDPPPN